MNNNINNTRGMQMKLAFFALIVVGIIITATGVLISEWSSHYNSGITYDLAEYDDTDNVLVEAELIKGKLVPQDSEFAGDFETNTYRAAYSVIADPFRPFRNVFGDGGMLQSVTDRYGLPGYVPEAIFAMIIFSFVTMIIAIVFRMTRSNA